MPTDIPVRIFHINQKRRFDMGFDLPYFKIFLFVTFAVACGHFLSSVLQTILASQIAKITDKYNKNVNKNAKEK